MFVVKVKSSTDGTTTFTQGPVETKQQAIAIHHTPKCIEPYHSPLCIVSFNSGHLWSKKKRLCLPHEQTQPQIRNGGATNIPREQVINKNRFPFARFLLVRFDTPIQQNQCAVRLPLFS
jgi:hypothetical protein